MNIKKTASQIEAILFLSTRPVSFNKLKKMLQIQDVELREAIDELKIERNVEQSGIHVIEGEGVIELGTNPNYTDLLKKMTKEETESELTRPQLETLTIIAYRGPVTRPEIEHIRGVNCSIILRNLAMRGLIVAKEDKEYFQDTYVLSTEMLRHLGVHEVNELPDFEKLNKNERINKLLETVFNTEEV